MNFCAYPYTQEEMIKRETEKYGYYYKNEVGFENQDDLFWSKNSLYKRIWSFKQLLRWRRLIPKKYECLEYKCFRWHKIESPEVKRWKKETKELDRQAGIALKAEKKRWEEMREELIDEKIAEANIKCEVAEEKSFEWKQNPYIKETIEYVFTIKFNQLHNTEFKNGDIKIKNMGKLICNNRIFFWLEYDSLCKISCYIESEKISNSLLDIPYSLEISEIEKILNDLYKSNCKINTYIWGSII